MTVKLASSGAGHGGAKTNNKWRDSGALSADKKRTEADITRTINSKLLKLVNAVDTTDNKGANVNDNLYHISRNINNAPDGIALSHHLNAFNGKATGVEVLYGSNADKPLASELSATIAKALGVVDRGAKDGSWLAIARNTSQNKKVLLIEWCFIDNPSDLAKLDKNMDKAIEAVAKIFGYKPQAVKPKPVKPRPVAPTKPKLLSSTAIRDEVIAGKWGSGQDRINRLTKAGYVAKKVQDDVNKKLLGKTAPKKKTNQEIANEIYRGQGGWGNGTTRINKLKAAGYDPVVIQNLVNKMFK